MRVRKADKGNTGKTKKWGYRHHGGTPIWMMRDSLYIRSVCIKGQQEFRYAAGIRGNIILLVVNDDPAWCQIKILRMEGISQEFLVVDQNRYRDWLSASLQSQIVSNSVYPEYKTDCFDKSR